MDELCSRQSPIPCERPLSLFNVTCLAKTNFRTMNVHMYNPHVSDLAIEAFLSRFCDVTSGAKMVKDSLGFWNGRRQFQVGMLFYARQPPFCRKCMLYGHGAANCSVQKCRFCHAEGHEAKDCKEPKECHGCGSRQHLFRDCLSCQKSYAAAAAGRQGTGEPPVLGHEC
uniref:CCHC-type domain-containing protein n=1 Tax=Esox lucius TaxID=8010 RepID=A0AAY5K6P5_ESOLU